DHGITPKGVQKRVADIMEGARIPGQKDKRPAKGRKVAEPAADYRQKLRSLSPAQLAKEIKRLENQMFEHAKNLEFEEAARLRDQLTELKHEAFVDPA